MTKGGFEMIDLDGMLSIPFLKKTVFTGSHAGMHFMIRKIKEEEKEQEQLQAIVWPGPFSFSVTEEEKKTFREFEFNEEGLKKSIEWLNEYYENTFCNLYKEDGLTVRSRRISEK